MNITHKSKWISRKWKICCMNIYVNSIWDIIRLCITQMMMSLMNELHLIFFQIHSKFQLELCILISCNISIRVVHFIHLFKRNFPTSRFNWMEILNTRQLNRPSYWSLLFYNFRFEFMVFFYHFWKHHNDFNTNNVRRVNVSGSENWQLNEEKKYENRMK